MYLKQLRKITFMSYEAALIGGVLNAALLHSPAVLALPHSSILDPAEVRQLLVENLRTDIRDVLLDHPELLKGIPVDELRITGDVSVNWDDEEGYVVGEASSGLHLPRGRGDAVDVVGLQNLVATQVPARHPDWGPLAVSVGSYRPVRAKVPEIYRVAALGVASFGIGLALFALWGPWRRKRLLASVQPTWQTVYQNQKPVLRERRRVRVPDVGEPPVKETLPPVESPPRRLTLTRQSAAPESLSKLTSSIKREDLPNSSATALDALAQLPLDEALDILAQFKKDERNSIIEFLPLHPALKQRLRKGLRISPE